MDKNQAPSRTSTLTLHPISSDNWRQVARLKPTPAQEGNLASNAFSLIESHYSADKAWTRAISAHDTIVGFLMMSLDVPANEFCIWRFMIDQRYQGLGFGKQSVELAIAHVRREFPDARELWVNSTPREGNEDVEARHSPYDFYVKLGFVLKSGPDEDGEMSLVLDLTRT